VQSPVAVVVKGYPRLSETFIAQEILALERLGLPVLIVSLRRPTDDRVHDLHRAIRAPVLHLPEYLRDAPGRVLAAGLRQLVRNPRLGGTLRAWLRDLRRDRTPNRVRRLGQALVLADELPADARRVHAHYLHTPASVARYAALLRGLPFSVSAHAKDVWTIPDWEKREKLLAADWAVTCSRLNADHLRALVPEADLELVYHGLDLARFPAPPRRPPGPDGSDPARPVRIVAVARAVEKKGLDVLLDALALLPPDLHWRLEHMGGGPVAETLEGRASALGLEARVAWRGSATQDEVLEALRRADLFCLPSRVARDGDRDGLPNVIMEAMSQELPVVATRAAAIPEIVREEVTGLLVPPEDAGELAGALATLARRPDLRAEMGRAGRRRVAEEFGAERGVARLAARFGLGTAAPAEAAA
jgi:glycosyltransferase involved in cell wall biosynthesis